MNMHWITTSVAAVSIASLMSAAPATAAMFPALQHSNPAVQSVDCVVGFHLGPAGACIIGVEEEHHDVVIEKRRSSDDCTTKTVKRTNDEGDSVTQTTKRCD